MVAPADEFAAKRERITRALEVAVSAGSAAAEGARERERSRARSIADAQDMEAPASKRKRAARDEEPVVSDGPVDLVRKLLQHREALRLYSTVAPEEQPPETSVWGLCEESDEDHFDAMDEDFNRNSAYTRAFAAVPATKTKWVEVGCGASATLTKLVLAHGPADAHRRVKSADLIVP